MPIIDSYNFGSFIIIVLVYFNNRSIWKFLINKGVHINVCSENINNITNPNQVTIHFYSISEMPFGDGT